MAASRQDDFPDLGEIAAALAERALDVCRHYLRGDVRTGNRWQAGDVTGVAGQSLSVNLSGPRVGRWRDAATGDHGDLLAPIMRNGDHMTLGSAIKEARAFLDGWHDVPEPSPTFAKVAEKNP